MKAIWIFIGVIIFAAGLFFPTAFGFSLSTIGSCSGFTSGSQGCLTIQSSSTGSFVVENSAGNQFVAGPYPFPGSVTLDPGTYMLEFASSLAIPNELVTIQTNQVQTITVVSSLVTTTTTQTISSSTTIVDTTTITSPTTITTTQSGTQTTITYSTSTVVTDTTTYTSPTVITQTVTTTSTGSPIQGSCTLNSQNEDEKTLVITSSNLSSLQIVCSITSGSVYQVYISYNGPTGPSSNFALTPSNGGTIYSGVIPLSSSGLYNVQISATDGLQTQLIDSSFVQYDTSPSCNSSICVPLHGQTISALLILGPILVFAGFVIPTEKSILW